MNCRNNRIVWVRFDHISLAAAAADDDLCFECDVCALAVYPTKKIIFTNIVRNNRKLKDISS